MDDQKIISLFWMRSEDAIAAASEQYGAYCRSIAHRILQNEADVEECLNDTWMGAWNAIPPCRPNSLSVFLGKMTRNFALNRVKYETAQKRGEGETALVLSELEDCIPSENGVEEQFDEMLLIGAIEDFLRKQTKEKRQIFVQRYWFMMPVKEIANTYGMREGKIHSMLFRMRNELKLYLEKEGIQV